MPLFTRWLCALLAVALLVAAPASAQEWTAPDEPVIAAEPPPVPAGWETVRGTWVEVHGASDSVPLLLELSRHASTSLPEMADELGVPIGAPIDVYVAPTQQAFETLQPGRAPEWADGTAYPSMGAIFLRRPRLRGAGQRPLQVVLDHELVHVLLGRAFAPNQPPRWLQEGVAQVMAGEHDPAVVQRLARGQLTGGLLTFEEIAYGFPRDARRADLAYAQSADFVDWILATHGEEALRTIVHELSAGEDIRRAIRAATGQGLEQVDREWRSRFSTGVPLWISALGSMDTWWFLAGVLAFGGLLLARRRLRRRMEDYAREEAERDALLEALFRRHTEDDTIH